MWSNQKDKLLKVSPAAIVHDRPNIVWPSSICIWFPCKQHSESLDSCYSLPSFSQVITAVSYWAVFTLCYPGWFYDIFPLAKQYLRGHHKSWTNSWLTRAPIHTILTLCALLISTLNLTAKLHALNLVNLSRPRNVTNRVRFGQNVSKIFSRLWQSKHQIKNTSAQAFNILHSISFQASCQIGLPCLI